MYIYRAKVKRITDGDTIVVDIDLGFETIINNVKLRLYGINTPETKGATRVAGLQAKEFVERQLPVGTSVILKTYRDKTEKYGRYLAEVTKEGESDTINLTLLRLGLATEYLGEGVRN